jgi:hypothetical protein
MFPQRRENGSLVAGKPCPSGPLLMGPLLKDLDIDNYLRRK